MTPYPIRSTALVLAHPGHELRVWRWLEIHRPQVVVFTDGSGRSGVPRIHTTGKLLRESGSRAGTLFGEFTDRFLYSQIQKTNLGFFEYLTNRLAVDFIQHEVEVVVGDAAEGIILAHDLLREVRRSAIRIAEQKLGYTIQHLEFPIDSHPDLLPPSSIGEHSRIELSEKELKRKLNIARNYEELADVVDAVIEALGENAFMGESLFLPNERTYLPDPGEAIGYETHGKQMVDLAHYEEVLLFQKHVLPIVSFLDQLQSLEVGKCVRGVS